MPATSGSRIQVSFASARWPQTARPSVANCARSPVTPTKAASELASLSLHWARSTNIDKRFSVAANTLAWQASSTSSSPGFQITKLASNRPLAEQ